MEKIVGEELYSMFCDICCIDGIGDDTCMEIEIPIR